MKLLNLGILAHVDAGKTTTVEQMLFLSGQVRQLGSVDKGNTQTDFLPIERERGISVATASVTIEASGVKINIIDTPGHMDFTGEVERALSVLDGVVLVVSAAEGIQSQTERFWKALREMKIPTVIFLNKIDRNGCDPEAVLKSLKEEFSPKIIPVNPAVTNTPPVWAGRETSPTAPNTGASHPALTTTGGEIPHLQTPPTRHFAPVTALESGESPLSDDDILELCENDSHLAEQFLDHGNTTGAYASLSTQTKQAIAFPLVYGAAISGIGIPALLQTITNTLPASPLNPTGDPTGIIYKIEHDKTAGKIAHVRLFGGTVKNRDTVTIHRHGLAEPFQEKITQIHKLSGQKREDTGQAHGNEIAAICGMPNVKAGDMLGQLLERAHSKIAVPLFSVQVMGPAGKENQLLQAISELADEDPLMEYSWNYEERELHIRTMGKIQLEILEYLLQERYNIPVQFSPPSVIYKETVAHTGIGFEAYTMPKPCWAIVRLQAQPLPRGAGFKYQSTTHKSVLQDRYQNHVQIAVADAIKQGRLGWEVTDTLFTLLEGDSHIYHTHPMDFFLATPIAVMRALEAATPILLEPLVKLRLTTTEDLSGRLIGDIIKMRGEFDSPVIKDGKLEMEAIVPVATSMDYSIKFSSLTSGRGIIKSDFYGYVDCPMETGRVSKRRGIDPLDRDKWILFKRGAL